MTAFHRLLGIVSSLRLTLYCLAAAFVLVFAGTLAQVNLNTFLVQQQYFQSWIIWWTVDLIPYDAQARMAFVLKGLNAVLENFRGTRVPVFPGGHLIGGVLLLNLISAHIRRFSWSWRKCGIQLIHLGLIIMLAGGLATDLFSVHSFMRLKEGETKNYSEDEMRRELAVTELTGQQATDQVIALPGELLADGGTITHDLLPFRIEVRKYFRNSELSMISEKRTDSPVAASSQGAGARISAKDKPRATKPEDQDTVSAVVEIVSVKGGESLGTWLVSDAMMAPQEFELDGRQWSLLLRPARYYKPYSLSLIDFTHETYPGTQIAKDFSSKVTLIDSEQKENRVVKIYMNHPLRYQGETYYQAGFIQDNSGTVLQVVRNPSYQAPYIACIIVSLGLLIQFIYQLTGFARRINAAPAP